MHDVNYVKPAHISSGAAVILNSMSHLPKADQAAALACSFYVICDVLNVDPRELVEKAENIILDSDRLYRREFRALKSYAYNEITY